MNAPSFVATIASLDSAEINLVVDRCNRDFTMQHNAEPSLPRLILNSSSVFVNLFGDQMKLFFTMHHVPFAKRICEKSAFYKCFIDYCMCKWWSEYFLQWSKNIKARILFFLFWPLRTRPIFIFFWIQLRNIMCYTVLFRKRATRKIFNDASGSTAYHDGMRKTEHETGCPFWSRLSRGKKTFFLISFAHIFEASSLYCIINSLEGSVERKMFCTVSAKTYF